MWYLYKYYSLSVMLAICLLKTQQSRNFVFFSQLKLLGAKMCVCGVPFWFPLLMWWCFLFVCFYLCCFSRTEQV